MNGLFLLAPDVQLAVALIGAVTLLIAGASALTQRDVKRVLAYSTMSQVGYMFLALGVGAWWAAIFHLVTHAFFKALLFLSAGVVIQALDEEHDILKMGGLRKSLPVAFWTFLIGAASLSALPFVTAGYYSKDLILSLVWSSSKGGTLLWLAGVVGALLTALYAFRLVFVVFFGTRTRQVEERSTMAMKVPLMVLALFAVGAAVLAVPQTPGGALSLAALAQAALPAAPSGPAAGPGLFAVRTVASLVPLLGIFLAALFYVVRPSSVAAVLRHRAFSVLHRFWFSGWGIDWVYRTLLTDPFVRLARLNRADVIDFFYRGIARAAELGNRALVPTQSGNVRWYVMGIALGGAVLIAVVLFL
jgi:NADH-quinone oxidoreductase subunit L